MAFPSIVHRFENTRAVVALYGPDYGPHTLRQLAAITDKRINPRLTCIAKAASTFRDTGFKKIVGPNYANTGGKPNVFADGVQLVRSGSAVVIQSADCPIGILYEATLHKLVVFHAGLAALTPTNSVGDVNNIVTFAYRRIVGDTKKPQVSAYITGSLCAKHFLHERTKAWPLIEPFLEAFGELAVPDIELSTVDMPAIMTCQLLELGVPEANINFDGHCTYETSWQASYRRNREGYNKGDRNTVVAGLL